MAEAPPEPSLEAEQTADRVARNTSFRALGEVLGKLASLVLFAALARTVGESELGIFVFALAWVQIANIPVDLGFDWYVVRQVSRDRSQLQELFFNVIVLKLQRAALVAVPSFVLINVLGYDSSTRQAVYLLAAGTLFDSLSQTVFAVFNAHERGYLAGAAVAVQRFAAAGLGLLALALGGGVVTVSLTFSVGTGVGLVIALILLHRSIGLPARTFPREGRAALRRTSRTYGAQDVFGIALAKVDVLLLSFLATDAAVGRYGAAYRLLEATFFLVTAVSGAFIAMFAYLGPDTEPTIKAVFGHAIKLALAVLVPCAVTFAVLAEAIAPLIFGDDVGGAAAPLRLLGGAVALMGIVQLGSSLLIGRREPHVIVRLAGAALVVNIGLNLALIPSLGDRGAAAAMLITGALFAGLIMFEASRTVDGMNWRATFAGPLAAGAAMAVVMLPLTGSAVVALPVGLVTYVAVLIVMERAFNPGDLAFVVGMLRRRLPFVAARPGP